MLFHEKGIMQHPATGTAEMESKDASVHEEADENSFHALVLTFFCCAVLTGGGDLDSAPLSTKGWLFFQNVTV